MQQKPTMLENKCQKEVAGMSARYVFDKIPDSCCCVVLDRDMWYCKGIHDKGGGSKFRSLEEKIAQSDYDDNIGYFIQKKLHVWCPLPSGLWELGMIRWHEVLRSLTYNLKNWKAICHGLLQFVFVFSTDVNELVYDACCWKINLGGLIGTLWANFWRRIFVHCNCLIDCLREGVQMYICFMWPL